METLKRLVQKHPLLGPPEKEDLQRTGEIFESWTQPAHQQGSRTERKAVRPKMDVQACCFWKAKVA